MPNMECLGLIKYVNYAGYRWIDGLDLVFLHLMCKQIIAERRDLIVLRCFIISIIYRKHIK